MEVDRETHTQLVNVQRIGAYGILEPIRSIISSSPLKNSENIKEESVGWIVRVRIQGGWHETVPSGHDTAITSMNSEQQLWLPVEYQASQSTFQQGWGKGSHRRPHP